MTTFFVIAIIAFVALFWLLYAAVSWLVAPPPQESDHDKRASDLKHA